MQDSILASFEITNRPSCYTDFVKVIFTKHAAKAKFAMFRKHKFPTKITQQTIKDIVKHPEQVDTTSDAPQIIASKSIDAKHILRVVYRKEHDIIIVITFYPAEKGRYYEDPKKN